MKDGDITKPCWSWATAAGAEQTTNDARYRVCPGSLEASALAPALTDHAAATVAALQRIIDKLNAGASPEDLGRDVELLGRIMVRRI